MWPNMVSTNKILFVFTLLLFVALIQAKKVGKKSGFPKKRWLAVPGLPCKANQFQCNDNICIQSRWRCDTQDDCLDNSDEVGCPTNCTGENQLLCKNGRCLPAHYMCDGDDDCGDSTDEDPLICVDFQCAWDEVKCDNHVCIDKKWLCDDDDDCGNGWDERNCSTCNT